MGQAARGRPGAGEAAAGRVREVSAAGGGHRPGWRGLPALCVTPGGGWSWAGTRSPFHAAKPLGWAGVGCPGHPPPAPSRQRWNHRVHESLPASGKPALPPAPSAPAAGWWWLCRRLGFAVPPSPCPVPPGGLAPQQGRPGLAGVGGAGGERDRGWQRRQEKAAGPSRQAGSQGRVGLEPCPRAGAGAGWGADWGWRVGWEWDGAPCLGGDGIWVCRSRIRDGLARSPCWVCRNGSVLCGAGSGLCMDSIRAVHGRDPCCAWTGSVLCIDSICAVHGQDPCCVWTGSVLCTDRICAVDG